MVSSLLGQADCVGLTEALSAEPAPCDVSAGNDVEGLFLSRRSLTILKRDPEFWREAYRFLVRAQNRLLDRLAVQALCRLDGRLAYFLLDVAPLLERTPALQITQGLIAQGVGASRPKVNRVLQRFRDLALVALHNGQVIGITDRAGLRQLIR